MFIIFINHKNLLLKVGNLQRDWILRLAQVYTPDLTLTQKKNLADLDQRIEEIEREFVSKESQQMAHLGFMMPETVVKLAELSLNARAILEQDFKKAGYDPKLIQEVIEESETEISYLQHNFLLKKRGVEINNLDLHLDNSYRDFMAVLRSVNTRYRQQDVAAREMGMITHLAQRGVKLYASEQEEIKEMNLDLGNQLEEAFSQQEVLESVTSDSDQREEEFAEKTEEEQLRFIDKEIEEREKEKIERRLPVFSSHEEIMFIRTGARNLIFGLEQELDKYGDDDGVDEQNIKNYVQLLRSVSGLLNDLDDFTTAGKLRDLSNAISDGRFSYPTLLAAHSSLENLVISGKGAETFSGASPRVINLAMEIAKLYRGIFSQSLLQPLVIDKGETTFTFVEERFMAAVTGGEDHFSLSDVVGKLIERSVYTLNEKGELIENELFRKLATEENLKHFSAKIVVLGVPQVIADDYTMRLHQELGYDFDQEKSASNHSSRAKSKDIVAESSRLSMIATLQEIEELFHEMPTYYFNHSGEKVKEEIKRRADKINSYTTSLRIPEVNYSSSLLNILAEEIEDKDKLLRKLTDYDQGNQLYRKIITAHAELLGINLHKISRIREAAPEKISMLLQMVKHYQEIVEERMARIDENEFKREYLDEMVERCANDNIVRETVGVIPHAATDLHSDLMSLGLEYSVAKILSNRLRNTLLAGKKIETENYPKEVSGRKTGLEFDLRFYRPDEQPGSRSIVREISVLLREKGFVPSRGKIISSEKAIHTVNYRDHQQFLQVAEIFPEGEIYASGNLGVSHVFDQTFYGFPRNPRRGYVEVLQTEEMDQLTEEAINTQVVYHEKRHVRQISSETKWNSLATTIATFMLDYSIEKMEKGVLDKEAYYRSLIFLMSQPDGAAQENSVSKSGKQSMTWREMIVQYLDMFMKQALGEGPLAERMREQGMMEGFILYDTNGDKIGDRDYLKLREEVFETELSKIKLKEGETTNFINRVYTSLNDQEGKINLYQLKALWLEGRERMEEFSTVIETDAEVNGFRLMWETLQEKHGNDEKIFANYETMLRQGEMGKKFFEICGEATEITVEMEAELNRNGMTYMRAIDNYHEYKIVQDNLQKLGFSTNLEAYQDISTLQKRLNEYNQNNPEQIALRDVLLRTNFHKAAIGVRYRGNLQAAIELSKEIGLPAFCDRAENVHRLADLFAT